MIPTKEEFKIMNEGTFKEQTRLFLVHIWDDEWIEESYKYNKFRDKCIRNYEKIVKNKKVFK